MARLQVCTCLPLCLVYVASTIIDIEVDRGAIPHKNDAKTWKHNQQIVNSTLNALQPGDTLVIPNKTFVLYGGITADDVSGVTIQIDGTLEYAPDTENWPRNSAEKGTDGRAQVLHCLHGKNWKDVVFTSSGVGTMKGNGKKWWGAPLFGYLNRVENRPMLIFIEGSKNVLYENIEMLESPYWTFKFSHCDGLEVRNCRIDNRAYQEQGHAHGIDIATAFNTDGFDVTGRNVWIHDSSIWNQDDCIGVKDDSQDMLFERINASGTGLTIGSIGNATVRNITFRNIYMDETFKGIYIKFRNLKNGKTGLIEDITYENIVMHKPSQYPIWIGPAQQSDSREFWEGHPCSLFWPMFPGSTCDPQEGGQFANITLKNIQINNPKGDAGLLFAHESTPMKGIVFEDVVVKNPGSGNFKHAYYSKGVGGAVARGKTWPIPPNFEDETGSCVSDGGCEKEGRTCCSGRRHSTLNCGSTGQRCGCVSGGQCATNEHDCCSKKGHKTLECSAFIGYRCDHHAGLETLFL